MKEPFISVVIPVYGVEKYIEKCLESCFSNTIVEQCEFLIINDCSPDNSIELAEKTIKKFPNITVKIISHEKNKGLAAARNTGLKNATGKYIINVDSDDWVEKDYLEKLYNEAEKSEADVVCCNLIREYTDISLKEKMPVPENPEVALSYLMQGKVLGYTTLRLVRRSLFIENNFSWIEGLNMCEDLLIMTKIFHFAKKISYIDAYLYHYNCVNINSLSASLNENKVKQLISVSSEIENFLINENVCKKYEKELLTQKSRFKIWINKCAVEKKQEYLELYETEKLYRDKFSSLFIRFFMLCCNLHLFLLAKFMIRIKLYLEK